MKSTAVADRPLPHNIEAERSVIGAILLGSPVAKEAILALKPSDFFLPQHQVIYRHLSRLHEQEKPTNDLVLLYDSLDASGELEAAGGVAYISQVPDGMPRISNLPHYVEIVKLKATLRAGAYTAERILGMLMSANGNAREILDEVSILSAHLTVKIGQKRILSFRSGAELSTATDERVAWIVKGFVARGAITELGAKVKAGKTTLIMGLVRAAAEGLGFLNQPTLKTPAVYLTEQPLVSFRQAMQRAGLIGRHDFFVLAYTETLGMKWSEVASAAASECKRVGAHLLIVDTLPQFAGLTGDSENNSGDALEAMRPLQQAAAEGIGIVIIRHERKAGGDVGDSARGSSAFAGAADIVLSLRKSKGNSRKTVRVLQALSRFSETPPELLIELTDKGYIALGEPHEAAVKEAKGSILMVAPRAESEAVTLKELADGAEVPRATVQRAIDELLKASMLGRIGKGKKGDPFRYFVGEIPFCPTSHICGQKEIIRDSPSGADSG